MSEEILSLALKTHDSCIIKPCFADYFQCASLHKEPAPQ